MPAAKENTPPRKFATVCRRVLYNTDPQYFPRAQYRGRTIYFCTEACLGAFLADPENFYNAHRKSKDPQKSYDPIKHEEG